MLLLEVCVQSLRWDRIQDARPKYPTAPQAHPPSGIRSGEDLGARGLGGALCSDAVSFSGLEVSVKQRIIFNFDFLFTTVGE